MRCASQAANADEHTICGGFVRCKQTLFIKLYIGHCRASGQVGVRDANQTADIDLAQTKPIITAVIDGIAGDGAVLDSGRIGRVVIVGNAHQAANAVCTGFVAASITLDCVNRPGITVHDDVAQACANSRTKQTDIKAGS